MIMYTASIKYRGELGGPKEWIWGHGAAEAEECFYFSLTIHCICKYIYNEGGKYPIATIIL